MYRGESVEELGGKFFDTFCADLTSLDCKDWFHLVYTLVTTACDVL